MRKEEMDINLVNLLDMSPENTSVATFNSVADWATGDMVVEKCLIDVLKFGKKFNYLTYVENNDTY